MKTQSRQDPRPSFAVDVLGSAIALAIVWGAFATLFEAPVERTVSVELYDSVMTDEQDWQMLASR